MLYYISTRLWLSEECFNIQKKGINVEGFIDNLSGGKSYFVRVKAVKDGEEGTPSDPVEIVTTPGVANQQMVQTDATSSSVTVRWDAVPGATEYDIYVSNLNVAIDNYKVGTTTATSATIKNLPADTVSKIFVYPTRTAATTKFRTDLGDNVTLGGVKTAPGKIGLIVENRDPRKKVNRSKNPDYNTVEVGYGYARNASGYEVYLFNAKGQKIKTIDNPVVTNTFSQFKGVKTTDTVSVQVVPYVLINGVKKYGVPGDKVLSVGAPTAKVKKSGSGVKISWSKVKNAKKYEVYMSTDGKNFKKVKTVKGNKKSVVLKKFKGKKFKKGPTYHYYVKAVGNYGGKKNAKSDIFYSNSFWFTTKYVK
ncbi:MAG: fibronectin type III domain-containing protein [Lachnospiraceae bacterium]|nr:fibronectin type III domain-containing protein [Lachnospiraceae bacterium]